MSNIPVCMCTCLCVYMYLVHMQCKQSYTSTQCTYMVVARYAYINISQWGACATESNHRNVDIRSLGHCLQREREAQEKIKKRITANINVMYSIKICIRVRVVHVMG